MSLDRMIRFGGDPPGEAALGELLRAYVGGGGEVYWAEDIGRWMVDLHGEVSSPFRAAELLAESRWFEVVETAGGVSVITRHGDEFTSAVADGAAAAICRRWQGSRE